MYPPVVNDTSGGGAAASNTLRELVEAFELLENHVRRADTRGVFDAVTTVAARQLDQADWASITVLERDVFRTESATHRQAREGDQLQYASRSGPCVDALVDAAQLHVPDTATNPGGRHSFRGRVKSWAFEACCRSG